MSIQAQQLAAKQDGRFIDLTGDQDGGSLAPEAAASRDRLPAQVSEMQKLCVDPLEPSEMSAIERLEAAAVATPVCIIVMSLSAGRCPPMWRRCSAASSPEGSRQATTLRQSTQAKSTNSLR